MKTFEMMVIAESKKETYMVSLKDSLIIFYNSKDGFVYKDGTKVKVDEFPIKDFLYIDGWVKTEPLKTEAIIWHEFKKEKPPKNNIYLTLGNFAFLIKTLSEIPNISLYEDNVFMVPTNYEITHWAYITYPKK